MTLFPPLDIETIYAVADQIEGITEIAGFRFIILKKGILPANEAHFVQDGRCLAKLVLTTSETAN